VPEDFESLDRGLKRFIEEAKPNSGHDEAAAMTQPACLVTRTSSRKAGCAHTRHPKDRFGFLEDALKTPDSFYIDRQDATIDCAAAGSPGPP